MADPHTIDDIAPNGDVIFLIQDTRLRVHSVILSSASTVFRAMFGGKFSEGQGIRTAKQPKEVPLPDDDISTMARLCKLLHHHRDPQDPVTDGKTADQRAKELYNISILADKYDCTDAISSVVKWLFSHFDLSEIREKISAEATLYVAAAAYVLGDAHKFALSTRRLVMDYQMCYSELLDHPAFLILPAVFLLHLEEQRNSALRELQEKLDHAAEKTCAQYKYPARAADHSFRVTLAEKIDYSSVKVWPPSVRQSTLRTTLRKTRDGGALFIQPMFSCIHAPGYNYSVTSSTLADVCSATNGLALGLCFHCINAGPQSTPCPHRLERVKWISGDSIS